MHLILEGSLEEAVAEKLLAHCGHEMGTVYGRSGAAYIRQKAAMFRSLATECSGVLVLTDFRDTGSPCPAHALAAYAVKQISAARPTFLCRFAVAELESWLIADSQGLSAFLKVAVANIPANPDTLPDPKRKLVNLARRCRTTSIRNSIVPENSHGGKVAPAYTATMSAFVRDHWNIVSAAKNSPSLARCVQRLQQL